MKIAEKFLQILCASVAMIGMLYVVWFTMLSQQGQMTIDQAVEVYTGMLARAQSAGMWTLIALVLSVITLVVSVLAKKGSLVASIIRSAAFLAGWIVNRTQVIAKVKDIIDNPYSISTINQEQAQQIGNQISTGLVIVLGCQAVGIIISAIAYRKRKAAEAEEAEAAEEY